jgi:rubrerythrin
MKKAALGGGALLTSETFMGVLPELAVAKPSKQNDIAILNYALNLEYLEAAFYNGAVASPTITGDALAVAKFIAAHENTHVSTLKKNIRSLGGKPVKPPVFDFRGTNADPTSFLSTAFKLENTGVHAYLGQLGNLKSKALLGAAAAIVTVEARHAAIVAGLISDKPYDLTGAGHNYTPDGAFDTPQSKKKILEAVTATGFITG